METDDNIALLSFDGWRCGRVGLRIEADDAVMVKRWRCGRGGSHHEAEDAVMATAKNATDGFGRNSVTN